MRKIKGFGSRNCSYCQKMQPVLIELAQEGLIDIEFNEVSEKPKLFVEYGIESYPTLIFFNEDGEEYHRIIGEVPRGQVLEVYNEVL